MKPRVLLACLLLPVLSACSPAAPPEEQVAAPTPAPAAPAAARATGPVTPPTTDADMIASALSAAPEAVSRGAAVIAMDAKMQMRTLRPGTNGWTCMPDRPSPGVDPMCLDKNGLEWANARMAHTNPPAEKVGFAYMLMGGSDASNTDPFATQPNPGGRWVDTGPHVMVLNIGNRFDGYPTTAADPKVPYVMFPGTPYAHLMIPVE